MKTRVLDEIDSASLRAYVAWEPILPADSMPGEDNLALAPDPRAQHYWDGHATLSPLFRRVLGLPEGWPAWDVYLAYAQGVTWTSTPPTPSFWHHQLGDGPDAPVLDGPRFASQLCPLLGRLSSRP